MTVRTPRFLVLDVGALVAAGETSATTVVRKVTLPVTVRMRLMLAQPNNKQLATLVEVLDTLPVTALGHPLR